MASQKPIKYGLMGNYPTKLKAESERKRLKGLGVRYTRVKKAQYGGYDVLAGVKPIGPNGAGGLQMILTDAKQKEMQGW